MIELSREEMEERRLRAVSLFESGKRQCFICQRLRVSRTTASKWYRAWKNGESMNRRKPTGRPSFMKPSDIEYLKYLYELGPQVHGYRRFTTKNLRELIYSEFGILYDQDHIGRRMRAWGIWPKETRSKRINSRGMAQI